MTTTNPLRTIKDKLHAKRRLFYWTLPSVFVITYLLCLCVPRYYQSELKVVQEEHTINTHGILGQWLGQDQGLYRQIDAINYLVIPELINSYDFMVQLFTVPVQTTDGSFAGTYYEYIMLQHKNPFWSEIIPSFKQQRLPFSKISDEERKQILSQAVITDPTTINSYQQSAIKAIGSAISCKVDKTSEVITITITEQDARVTAMLANAVLQVLQSRLDAYHAGKVNDNARFYTELIREALSEHTAAQEAYLRFKQEHPGRLSEKEEMEALLLQENIRITFSTYESFRHQQRQVESQHMSGTNSFNILQSGFASKHPAGPHKTLISGLITILVAFFMLCWVARKELIEAII